MKYIFLFVCVCLIITSSLAQETQALTETFTSSQGTLTLSYPQGWLIDEMSGTISLTNEPLLGDRETPGWIGILMPLPKQVSGMETAGDLLGKLRTYISEEATPYTTVHALTINTYPAAQAEGCMADGLCQAYFSFLVAPQTVASVTVLYRPGGQQWDEGVILSILESIQYNPPDARPSGPPTPYVTSDGKISFAYPAGWIVTEEKGFIRVTNTDKFTGNPGQMLMQFTAYPLQEDPSLSPDATPIDALGVFVRNTGVASFSQPVSLLIGNHAAARIESATAYTHQTVYAVITNERVLIYASMLTATGEQMQFDQMLRVLINSIRYKLPAVYSTSELEAISLDKDALTTSYLMEVAGITFNHPDSWLVEAQGAYVIVATDDSFAQTGPTTPEHLAMIVDLITPERWAGLDSQPTFGDVFKIIPFEHSNTFTLFNLDGRPAAYSVRQSSRGYDIGLVIVQLDEASFGVIYSVAVSGALQAYEPTVFSIAATIAYTEAAEEN